MDVFRRLVEVSGSLHIQAAVLWEAVIVDRHGILPPVALTSPAGQLTLITSTALGVELHVTFIPASGALMNKWSSPCIY